MSNQNQYIESAKIAAETAASNAQLTMVVSILSALIALIGTGLTAWFTYKSAYRNAVADTLSKQRIEWLNSLRGKFVEFNNLAKEFYYNSNNINYKNEPIKTEFNFLDKFNLLNRTQNHISLSLNPKESIHNDLISELSFVRNLLHNKPFSPLDLDNGLKEIDYLQQIVLKAEWKRIKEEIKKGRELEPDEVSKIYSNISKLNQ